MDWILQPWPWYISGPLLGLTVPALLIFSGKSFGVSSSLRHLGSICSPKTKIAYLRDNDWRGERWNLVFVGGLVLGAFVAANFLSGAPVDLLPDHYQNWSGGLKHFAGGLLIGFGTRYADGCTSGHSIMGLSNLKVSSLVATLSFFAGGLALVGISQLLASTGG